MKEKNSTYDNYLQLMVIQLLCDLGLAKMANEIRHLVELLDIRCTAEDLLIHNIDYLDFEPCTESSVAVAFQDVAKSVSTTDDMKEALRIISKPQEINWINVDLFNNEELLKKLGDLLQPDQDDLIIG